MLKRIIGAAIMLCALGVYTPKIQAQSYHILLEISDSVLAENPFEQLDTSTYLTSGVLWDRAVPNVDFGNYSGMSADSAAGAGLYEQVYIDLKNAHIDPVGWPDFYNFQDIHQQQVIGYNALPITTFAYTYQTLKDHVLDSGLVSVVDSQIVITPGTGNPFLEKQLWLSSVPSESVALNDTVQIVIPAMNTFTNLTGMDSIASISLDADDGLGFRAVQWNTPVNLYYTGEAGSTKNVILKFTTAQGEMHYTRFAWKTSDRINCYPPAQYPPWPDHALTYEYYQLSNPSEPFWFGNPYYRVTKTEPVKYLMEAATPYQGKKALGKAYVRYRTGAAGDGSEGFKKPIIFVEGIDFERPYDLVAGHDPFNSSVNLGTNGWSTLWGCDDEKLFLPARSYLEDLLDEGYDIIMLDFYDGADYMQRNGLLLVELIERINQHKVGNEQNVVLGASMGGQVANWALTHMEANAIDHCTRLFISFDSPWKGANIPLAVQAFMHYFANDGDQAKAKSKLAWLRRPAAKQLLNYQIDYCLNNYAINSAHSGKINESDIDFSINGTLAPDPLFNQFQQDIDALGDYPKKCRNVAIINGNDQGVREFAGGAQYLAYDTNCKGFKAQADLFAPTSGVKVVATLNTKGAWLKRFRVRNSALLDNSPGSTRNDIDEIAKSIREGAADFKCYHHPGILQDESVFVPSISALAINTTNWDFDIQNGIDKNSSFLSGLTHFDAYYAPDFNEKHVATNPANMEWMVNQIRKGEQHLEVETSGVLTKTWNNPLENNYLSSVDINTGGTLYVNANRPVYDEAAAPNNANFPPPGGVSRVHIGGDCSSTEVININSGGKMVLGDANTSSNGNNKAFVYISEGAEINVNDGAELLIEEGSGLVVENGGKLSLNNAAHLKLLDKGNIVIEEGGELVFNSSQPIQLNDPHAELRIHGKLVVEDNRNFRFTGDGQIIFNQDIPWANGSPDFTNFYDFGANTSISFQGSSAHNDVVLECISPVYFVDEEGDRPQTLTITNAKVLLHPDALLFSYSANQINYTTFESTSSTAKHAGVRLWYHPDFGRIHHNTFRGGEYGLLAHWAGGSRMLLLEDNVFEDNTKGLQIETGRFLLTRNTFQDNTFGCIGQGVQGAPTVSHNTFKNNRVGAWLHGSNNTTFSITDNTFQNHAHAWGSLYDGVGLKLEEAVGNLRCNDFTNNEWGLQLNYADAYLNEDANNYFYNNEVAIEFIPDEEDYGGLYLQNGYNEFLLGGNSSNNLHIQGVFPYKGSFSSSLPNSNYVVNSSTGLEEMDARNNRFELRQLPNGPGGMCCLFEMPVAMTVSDANIDPWNPTTNPVKLYLPQNLASVERNCSSSNSGGGSNEHPGVAYLQGGLTSPNEGGRIGGPSGNTLLDVLIEGIEELSYGGGEDDDLLAWQSFYSALTESISEPDVSTPLMLVQAHDLMLSAIENSYLYGDLNHTQGDYTTEKPEELSSTIDFLDDKINALDPQSSIYTYWNFKYHLDKVLTYRNGGYYPEALNVLALDNLWANGLQQQRTNYWTCICQTEKDYFDESLEPEEYTLAIEVCRSQNAGATYKRQPDPATAKNTGYTIAENLPNGNLKVYPQPVQDELTIELEQGFTGTATYWLNDISGKNLKTGKLQSNGTQSTLDVKGLAPGVYFLNLQLGEQQKMVEVIKE